MTEGNKLLDLHFDVTGKCNLSCPYCYQKDYLKTSKELSLKKIENLTEELSDLGTESVLISGGEPFCREDIFDIMDKFEERDICIRTIITNGVLVNKEVVNGIKDLESDPLVIVSLDGPSPDSHNSIRGRTYKSVVRGIKNLLERSVQTATSTLVTNANFGEIYQLYRKWRDTNISKIRIGMPKNIGGAKVNEDFTNVKFDLAHSEYKRIIREHVERFYDEEDPSEPELQIEQVYIEEMFDGRLLPCSPERPICEYNLHGCCLKPDGSVTPCSMLVKEVYGYVHENSLKSIYYSKSMQDFKKTKIQEVIPQECRDCEALLFCGGGCRAQVKSTKGSFFGKDEIACKNIKFFFNEILPFFEQHSLNVVFSE